MEDKDLAHLTRRDASHIMRIRKGEMYASHIMRIRKGEMYASHIMRIRKGEMYMKRLTLDEIKMTSDLKALDEEYQQVSKEYSEDMSKWRKVAAWRSQSGMGDRDVEIIEAVCKQKLSDSGKRHAALLNKIHGIKMQVTASSHTALEDKLKAILAEPLKKEKEEKQKQELLQSKRKKMRIKRLF